MSADEGGSRSTRLAAVVLAGLFLFVPIANLLWPGPTPVDVGQPRMDPSTSPFPEFRMGPVLRVVPLEEEANQSTRLLMTSLQGLVNRDQAEIYLDVPGLAENTSTMLSFLRTRYNVTTDVLALEAAIDTYAPRAAGLVVVDPARPESVDIGTMIAAQRDALLVAPDLAGPMRNRFALPIILDYAASDWASLGPIAAYDRALRELYPSSSTTLLSILPPDRWAIRDYLIATRTFVFYHQQGILASPFEVAATERILRATPRGIPILGWFSTPTLTEENAFVQAASAAGKFVVGAQDVPNLSVLAALGRNGTHQQVPRPPSPIALENTTYVVLAVSDGDNLDFAAGRMRELWSEPARGTVPIAWSINPLLIELAPPLLDSYYDAATPLDEFVAAPSGAGYLYPDYAGPGDLASYVDFSRRYLEAADLDIVWLLNAFPASEIPYSSASLSTYVDGLRPQGIVLDYDDQPRTRDMWIQGGEEATAPVVRSTHLWTTTANLLGKVDAAAAAWDVGPHFLWLTLYPFRFGLEDARDLIDVIANRLSGGVKLVTPGDFFSLLRQDFVRSARDRLALTDADPLASLVLGPLVESARAQTREAEAQILAGRPERASRAAFLALEELRKIAELEALVASLLVVLATGLLTFLVSRSHRTSLASRFPIRFGVLLVLSGSVALLVFSLRSALAQDFWTYPTILIGLAVAGIHRPLRSFLDRSYPTHAPIVAALLLLVFTGLATRTSVGFPLALVGALLTIDTVLSRRSGSGGELLLGLLVGTAVGVLGPVDLAAFSVLAIVLVLGALNVRGPAGPEPPTSRSRAMLPGIVLALPLSALAAGGTYSLSLRLDVQGDALVVMAGVLLALGPTVAFSIHRAMPPMSHGIVGTTAFAFGAILGGLVLAVHGTVPTFLALLGLVASLSLGALAYLECFVENGGDPRRAFSAAVILLPLFVLFYRMPPIVYSLVIAPLPEVVEYALYAPTVITAAIGLVLAIHLGFLVKARVGKDYPGEGHDGAVGP